MSRLDNVTKEYDNHFLNIAIAYGGQNELVDAVKKIGDQIKDGSLDSKDINKEIICKTDATAAAGMAIRRGLGPVRHVEVKV